MTSDEAKVYLHTLRRGETRSANPHVAEALAQARRDPELRAWFETQLAVDSAVTKRLQQIPVPAGLADDILERRKARSTTRPQRHLLRVAMAAALVFLLALGAWLSGRFQRPLTEYTALQRDMAEFLTTFPQLDLATDRWTAISDWLTAKSGFSSVRLPAELQRFPGLGCREIEWRGRRLMLVCFAAEGQIVHLFVVRQGDLSGTPDNSRPQLSRVKGWTAAGWADDGVAWLALTRGNRTFLTNLLRTTAG
jgi:hypothetical protein